MGKHRLASLLIVVTLPLIVRDACAQPSQPTGRSAPTIRIESPADQSVIHTRQPLLRVCVAGADETSRASLRAHLDGEEITKGLRWNGECAEWSPDDKEEFMPGHHAWGDSPFDEDGWVPELREGRHTLEVVIEDPSGASITTTSQFRVETERAAVTLAGGSPSMELDEFEGDFAPVNLLEGRFGLHRVWTLARDPRVVRYRTKDFSIGGISTELWEDADEGETETTLGRIGVGKRAGYGYRTGDNGFIAPYHGTMAYLARLEVDNEPSVPQDLFFLEPFDDETRVATAFEGGIAFGIGRSMTVDAGYEETVVYPHWVFWEAAGSGLVHGIALGVADGISRRVARDSPRTAPIVSFLLRNAMSLALYNQRRHEVNWPFGGGSGLFYQGVKVSFTYSF